jgi:hypothetical protein
MKNPSLVHHRKSYFPLASALVVLALSSAVAQELTPARQLGQSSATNPYQLNPDGTTGPSSREQLSNAIGVSADTAGDVGAWWQGMEDVAEESVRSGPWAFHYGVTAAWEYDDNFNLSAGSAATRGTQDGETHVFSMSPYGVLTFGEPGHGVDVQIRYSPEFRWFTQENMDDIINHNLSMALGINGARSRMFVNGAYTRNEGGNVEVGNLITADTFTFQLGGSYDVSPKTTIGAAINTTIAEYESFNSFGNYGISTFVDYAITPKTRLGLGVGYDHLQQDNNRDANAVNVNLRLNWAATAKTGVSGSIGVEKREYSGGDSITALIGRFGVYYNPTEKVALQLSAYRNATPSIGTANAMFYSTGVAFTGSFQVATRVSTNLSVGFENAQYESTGGGITSREDDYFFIRPSLTYFISTHLSTSLFYQFTNNDSTAGNDFDRNQVGVSLTLAY